MPSSVPSMGWPLPSQGPNRKRGVLPGVDQHAGGERVDVVGAGQEVGADGDLLVGSERRDVERAGELDVHRQRPALLLDARADEVGEPRAAPRSSSSLTLAEGSVGSAPVVVAGASAVDAGAVSATEAASVEATGVVVGSATVSPPPSRAVRPQPASARASTARPTSGPRRVTSVASRISSRS